MLYPYSLCSIFLRTRHAQVRLCREFHDVVLLSLRSMRCFSLLCSAHFPRDVVECARKLMRQLKSEGGGGGGGGRLKRRCRGGTWSVTRYVEGL